ncbi:amino acid ABC transporter permease [Microbacterium elymi]|uniref:Amino acid ABC transporter permease n=1 Tax=Microbacterium elymi TaxID=2909587 RepID=A0ABY5NM08_9MICO|nr:amino acid ABC transporter permease [Microbacterium elymi]UUT36231.1 amino acid ABC transporter permease [Microbacterium elymi]
MMWDLLELLARGVGTTVLITVLSFVVGAVLAVPLVLLRRSPRRWLRLPALAVVELTRAVPPLVWLFIVYYGIGSGAVKLDTLQASVIGLGLISAAYLTEIYRAGLDGLPKGQWEASTALGMPRLASARTVILPQAVVTIIPPAATYAIGLLKDSAVASVIGAKDITFYANQQTQVDLNGLGNFAVAGLLYIALSIPVAVLGRAVDRRLSRRLVGA